LTRRIGVAATAQFGADVLERLGDRHELAFLLTRPDAPAGRGRRVTAPPAKIVAERLELPVLQPERLSSFDVPPDVDAIVVAAYGLLIPDVLLEQTLWLNVHPSLLPRWRGAAPVERTIMAGDRETGVTIHRTVKELDAGPIAGQAAFVVDDDMDAGAVFARSAELAAELLEGVLAKDEPRFEPQPDEGVTYAEKIAPDDRRLDLDDPEQAVRVVRALSPHIGARAVLDGRGVIVWRARAEEGRFVPLEVQPAGKRRMTYDEFRRGLR
jgi:methionyl-tRNA formyltransferase